MNNLKNNNKAAMDEVMLSWLSRMLLMCVCLALVMIIGFQSCNPVASLEGTYVNSAGSEFSSAHDTLEVEHEENNRYLIHRSTGFQLLDDTGKSGVWQHEKEEWTAVYDPKTEVMTERRNGKLITFDAARGTMTVGKRNYQRIK